MQPQKQFIIAIFKVKDAINVFITKLIIYFDNVKIINK